MPESPSSPTAAHQTTANSLLSHADSGGDGAAHGDSCRGASGEIWQSVLHKQVRPSCCLRPASSNTCGETNSP